MINSILFAVCGTALYGVVLYGAYKFKRFKTKKKNIEQSEYTLTFM